MTASIVDDLTNSESSKNKECLGQGLANIVSGFFGGMAGCAMIGQSVINVRSGGRGRLSTFIAGGFLLFLILVMDSFVQKIPMAALVSVMIMVSVGTFNWSSFKELKTHPLSSSIVMATTVVVVLFTHDLAKGVFAGVILSALFFAREISSSIFIDSILDANKKIRTYTVNGQLFFAATQNFLASFNFSESVEKIIIDISSARLWDCSATSALDRVVEKFEQQGKIVEVFTGKEIPISSAKQSE
jgi:SulP family sulfate permease